MAWVVICLILPMKTNTDKAYFDIDPGVGPLLELQPLGLVFRQQVADLLHVDLKVGRPHQVLLIGCACDVLEDVVKRVGDNATEIIVILHTCNISS